MTTKSDTISRLAAKTGCTPAQVEDVMNFAKANPMPVLSEDPGTVEIHTLFSEADLAKRRMEREAELAANPWLNPSKPDRSHQTAPLANDDRWNGPVKKKRSRWATEQRKHSERAESTDGRQTRHLGFDELVG